MVRGLGVDLTKSERLRVNLALRLRLGQLTLASKQGEKLVGFEELVVDLSIASVTRAAMVFDEIRLDGLDLTLQVCGDGRVEGDERCDDDNTVDGERWRRDQFERADQRRAINGDHLHGPVHGGL